MAASVASIHSTRGIIINEITNVCPQVFILLSHSIIFIIKKNFGRCRHCCWSCTVFLSIIAMPSKSLKDEINNTTLEAVFKILQIYFVCHGTYANDFNMTGMECYLCMRYINCDSGHVQTDRYDDEN